MAVAKGLKVSVTVPVKLTTTVRETLKDAPTTRLAIRHVVPIPQREGEGIPTFAEAANAVVQRTCAACGQHTQTMALTPFRPDLGAIPMHLTCSAALVALRKKMEQGELPDGEEGAALVRLNAFVQGVAFARELESGE